MAIDEVKIELKQNQEEIEKGNKFIHEMEDTKEFKEMMLRYTAALKEMNTKIDILNDEFKLTHKYNPIEYTKSRIKTPASIYNKLIRKGFEVSLESIAENLQDIAGTRIICSFTSDIYRLAEMISRQNDIEVITIKDYIKNPKPNGYRSYHMLVKVPIFLSNKVEKVIVELQIRTIAMDFWASLEHKIYYKFEGNAPKSITNDLKECADMAHALDEKMLSINNDIQQYK